MFHDRSFVAAEIEVLDEEFWSPENELMAELAIGALAGLLEDER